MSGKPEPRCGDGMGTLDRRFLRKHRDPVRQPHCIAVHPRLASRRGARRPSAAPGKNRPVRAGFRQKAATLTPGQFSAASVIALGCTGPGHAPAACVAVPYGLCLSTSSFVELVLNKLIAGQKVESIGLMAVGCYCPWNLNAGNAR
jgi:hypothetical protein